MDVTVGWAAPDPTGALVGLLDSEERARAETFTRSADRDRFIARRALLRLLVADLTGGDPGRLELGSRCPVCGGRDHGRPVLRTDASVQLSASSSGRRVVVAVARGEHPIGVDVEGIMQNGSAGVAFDAVAFTPAEQAWIMARPEPERAIARTEAWVRKEAVLKRAGVGLTVPPSDFDVAASEDVVTEIDVGGDYRCALATAEPVVVIVVDATARLAGRAARS